MNRYGFGILAFLGILCFLGMCLLISFIYYKKLFSYKGYTITSYQTVSNDEVKQMVNDYHDVNLSFENYYYLEKQLEKGAREYTKNYPMINENKIIITSQILYNKKIIEELYDIKGNICTGYVIYNSNQNYYMPYLNCGGYRSKDYVNFLE